MRSLLFSRLFFIIRRVASIALTSLQLHVSMLLILFGVSTFETTAQVPSWSAPIQITQGDNSFVHPVIANGEGWLFSGEEMMAISRNGKDIGIIRTTGGGANWSDSITYITTDSAENDFPSLVHSDYYVPSDEKAMLVWQSRTNGNSDIYYSVYSQSAWSLPQPVTTSPEDDILPHVAESPDRYIVTWEHRGQILFSEFVSGFWTTPLIISAAGDTTNHFPHVSILFAPPYNRPLVIWEKVKSPDTTTALMYAYRSGGVWTPPDTLVSSGDSHQPQFFKYGNEWIQWNKGSGNNSESFAGYASFMNGQLRLGSISPLTTDPEIRRDARVNGFMIVVANPLAIGYPWFSVAAWESMNLGGGPDSIGVNIGYYNSFEKLSADKLTTNRNPDVSQGTNAGSGAFRFWVVWEAEVLEKWQLHASSTLIIISDVAGISLSPPTFKLSQNYPNPFNPTTKIKYQIQNSNVVTLKVFDILGREVRTLVNEVKTAGEHSVTFDATGLTNGVYFYRMTAESYTQTRKLVLLR
ncbi:MAG TPA: T9SS type A sorting domain-containing protein [Bacteroidota bacterium]